MCCFQHTYRVCFVRMSVYSVKWNRTRQWIKDQEAKQGKVSAGTTTRLKTAVGLHLKTHWITLRSIAHTHTHTHRPTGFTDEYECLCLAELKALRANDRCINLLPLTLKGINKPIKQRKSCYLSSCVPPVSFLFIYLFILLEKTSFCRQVTGTLWVDV